MFVEHNLFAPKRTKNEDQCSLTKIHIPDDLFRQLHRLNEHDGMLRVVRNGIKLKWGSEVTR